MVLIPEAAGTAMYEFVGKLMGLAIRSQNYLSLNLPSIGTHG